MKNKRQLRLPSTDGHQYESLLARHIRVQHVFASCGDCGQSRVKEDARAMGERTDRRTDRRGEGAGGAGPGRRRRTREGGQTERQSYAMLNGKWMRRRQRRRREREREGEGHGREDGGRRGRLPAYLRLLDGSSARARARGREGGKSKRPLEAMRYGSRRRRKYRRAVPTLPIG